MIAWRLLLGGLGLAGAAYGAHELLQVGTSNLLAAGVWLVTGVLIHDGVVAPLTVLVGVLVVTLRGRAAPAPVVAGAVVLATVTVVAVPVLGRFGARADNPTLLDRNYGFGWLCLATLTVAVVAAAMAVRRRGGGDGASPGRR